jgi:prophage antirepressor-like protein
MENTNNKNTVTTSEIRTFTFEEYEIRIAIVDGKPWLVLSDVCKALGIENYDDAVRQLNDDEKAGIEIIDIRAEPQQNRGVALINEAGMCPFIDGHEKDVCIINTLGGPQKITTIH